MSGPAGANYPSSGTIKYAPIIFTKKVMRLFTESVILNEITNNDYEGEIKGKGDQVTVRVAPTYLNVGAYTVDTDITYEEPSEAARILNIDQAYYTAFKIDEIDKVQSDLDLMNIFAERAANSLNIDTSTRVLDVMGLGAGDNAADALGWGADTSGNIGATAGKVSGAYGLGVAGTPIQITADNAVDYIADLGTVLTEANVPEQGRFIVLPAWYCNFIKKGDLRRVDVTGDSTGVIRTGLIGQIDNFMVYQSNLVKHVTDSHTNDPEAFYVVAGVKDATTFASQVTKTETVVSEMTFGEKWRTLLVYGRKVIQSEALAMLYCTKDSLA